MCIRLAAATGARRGELVALQWSDFKGERMTIRRSLVESDDQLFERPTKTGSTIAVDAATLAADYHATQLLAAGVPVPTVS